MLELLSDPNFQYTFYPVAGLIVLAALIFIALVLAARRSRKGLSLAIAEIGKLNAVDGAISWAELEDAIKGTLPGHRLFQRQWSEFLETLTDVEGKPHNSMPVDHFIQDDEFLQSVKAIWFRFPFIHYLPGVATSLGVLGTFLGITFGLFSVEFEADSSIASLVSSLSGAFITSIGGVGASLLMSVSSGWTENSLLGELHEFREVVDRKIPRVTAERLLSISLRKQDVSNQLNQAGNDERLDFGKKLLSIVEEQTQIQKSMAANASTTTTSLEKISTMLPMMHELLQKQGLHAASQTEVLREQVDLLNDMTKEAEDSRAFLQTIATDLADSISTRFEATIQQHLAPQIIEMTEAVKNQVSSSGQNAEDQTRRFVDEAMQQIGGAMQTSFQGMGEQVEAMGAQFAESVSALDRILSSTSDSVEAQQAVLAQSQQAVVDAHSQSATAATQLSTVEGLTTNMGALLEKLATQHESASDMQNSQVKLQQSSEKTAAEVTETMEAAAGSYAKTASNLGGLMAQLERHVTKIGGSVEKLSESTASASSTVERASASLVQRTQQEEKLITGFHNASREFKVALDKGGPLIEHLGRAADSFSANQRDVAGLVSELKGVVNLLSHTGATLREGLASAEGSLRESAEKLVTVVDGTGQWAEKANRAIEVFGVSVSRIVEDSLKSYDQSLADAVGGLKSAMHQLEDTADEIAASASVRRGN